MKFIRLAVLCSGLLLGIKYYVLNPVETKSTEIIASNGTIPLIKKEEVLALLEDSTSSAKEFNIQLFSTTKENITSQIATILLNDRKIPIDSVNLIDKKIIKNVVVKHQKAAGIWLYIYTD